MAIVIALDLTMSYGLSMSNTEQLITTTEAMRILGVDRSTVSRWVAFGHLTPAMRVGTRGPMLFHRNTITELAKQKTDEATRTAKATESRSA